MLPHPYIPAIQQFKTRFVPISNKKSRAMVDMHCPQSFHLIVFLFFHSAMLSKASPWRVFSSAVSIAIWFQNGGFLRN